MRPGDLTPSTSTPTPVPTSGPVPSDFPWAQDGLTAIEREALDYLQHIEREHPPAFENVIGYQWLADGINEGERRFLCNVSQVAETSAALAIVQSVSPTVSPPVDYLAGCPSEHPFSHARAGSANYANAYAATHIHSNANTATRVHASPSTGAGYNPLARLSG